MRPVAKRSFINDVTSPTALYAVFAQYFTQRLFETGDVSVQSVDRWIWEPRVFEISLWFDRHMRVESHFHFLQKFDTLTRV